MNGIQNTRSEILLVTGALLAILCIGCSDDGTGPGNGSNGNGESLVWEEEYINRDDFTINDVWMSPDGVGFAVGYRGASDSPRSVVLSYDGTEWTSVELSGVDQELLSVSGVTASDVHAVGYGPVALHYDGSSWQTELLPNDSGSLWQVSAGASDFAIAVGYENLLRWNGSSWINVESIVGFHAVWARSGEEAYLLAREGIFRIDRENNVSPVVLTTDYFREIHGNSAGQIFVLGTRALYELEDGGVAGDYDVVELFSRDDVNYFTALWAASTGDVFVGSGESFVPVLRYDGESGSVEQMTLPHVWSGVDYIYSLFGRSSTDIVASRQSVILHCDGQAWSPMRMEPAQDVPALHAVHGMDSGNVWASSLDGGFYACHGNGVWNSDWRESPVGPIWVHPDVVVRVRPCQGEGCTDSDIEAFDPVTGSRLASYEHETDAGLNDLWGTADDDVFAVGSDARIFRFAGEAWAEMTDEVPSEETDTLRAISGASASEIYAVGDAGTVLRFDGAGWNVMATGVTVDLSDVWVDAATATVYVVGADATVLVNDGSGWSTMDVPADVTADLNAVWGFGVDDVYAFGDDGVALHYDGTSWESLQTPATAAIHDAWGTASGEIIAVCGDGRILRGEWK